MCGRQITSEKQKNTYPQANKGEKEMKIYIVSKEFETSDVVRYKKGR